MNEPIFNNPTLKEDLALLDTVIKDISVELQNKEKDINQQKTHKSRVKINDGLTRAQRHYRKNKEKVLAKTIKYYRNNREVAITRQTNWNMNNRDKTKQYRKINRLKKYGLTLESYEAMLATQNNCCALCHKPFGERSPDIDHNHITNKARGLLHHNCNILVRDDLQLMKQAVIYREKYE